MVGGVRVKGLTGLIIIHYIDQPLEVGESV